MDARLFTAIAGFVILVFCLILLMSKGQKSLKKISMVLFVPVAVCGFAAYFIGLLPSEFNAATAFETVLRALFSTGRMFFINDDYSYITENTSKAWLFETVWYELIFWACHALALFVTVSAVVAIFGKTLLDFMKLRFRRYDCAYIIIGMSPQAIALGKNIATHDAKLPKPDKKRLVVHLYKRLIDEEQKCLESYGAVSAEYNDSELGETLRKNGFRAMSWRIKLIKVFEMAESDAESYFISNAVVSAALDRKLEVSRLSIYVQTDSEWVIESLNELAAKQVGYDIHFFSEPDLAARCLIQAMPPYRYARLSGADAGRDFTTLFLGFGRIGRQAFKKTLMNSQFLGSSFHAHIVDEKINSFLGEFEEQHQGLNEFYDLKFHNTDVRGRDFYLLLDEIIGDLSYVVVALGDDEKSLKAARSIQAYLRKRNIEPSAGIAVSIFDHKFVIDTDDGLHVFSDYSDIFSEAIIIRDEINRLSRLVAGVYKNLTPNQTKELNENWNSLDYLKKESNRAMSDFIPAYANIVGLDLNETEFKSFLSEVDLNVRPVDFGWFEVSEELMEKLSKTEHERWNAFHYAMGYSVMGEAELGENLKRLSTTCDYASCPKSSGGVCVLSACREDKIAKKHICLVSWDELQTVADSYNKLIFENGIVDTKDFTDFYKNDRRNIENLPKYLAMLSQGNKS